MRSVAGVPRRLTAMSPFEHMGPVDATSLSSILVARWIGSSLTTPGLSTTTSLSPRIVGDVRLDAQAELARELGAGDQRGLDLVARAYERWQIAFAEHLVGDYAIVIVDPRASIVVAARDAFGVRRLAYRRVPNGIALGADVGALSALGAPRAELDESAVFGHLTDAPLSLERTLFRTVSRVPPGHTLVARAAGDSVRRHFAPPLGERRGPRDETVALVRSTFRTAVADRIAGDRPLIVQVSGGIDSSSIACMADGLGGAAPLHFVSARFRDADESDFVAAAAARLGGGIHVFDAEPSSEIDDPIDPGDPNRYPLAAQSRMIEALAARAGATAVLSGIGGDELFFERGVFRDLAQAGHFATLRRELRTVAWSRSPNFCLRDALRSLVPRRLERVIALTRRLRRKPSRASWLRAPPATVSPRTELDPPRFSSQTQKFTWEWLTSPRLVATLEAEDRAANAGLQMRYPFLDARLAAVVLATPYMQRLPRGRTKRLFRDALGETLPEAIRERTSVTIFDRALAKAVSTKRERLREAIEHGPWCSDRWVERSGARALLHRFEAAPDDVTVALALWDIATLELWLRALDSRREA